MTWPNDVPTKNSTTIDPQLEQFWETSSDGTILTRDKSNVMKVIHDYSYIFNGIQSVREAKVKEILNHYRQNASAEFSITPWIFHDSTESTITVRYNEGKAPSINNTQGKLLVSCSFVEVRDKDTAYS